MTEPVQQTTLQIHPGGFELSRKKIPSVTISDLKNSVGVPDRDLRSAWRESQFLEKKFIFEISRTGRIYGTDLPRALLPPTRSAWDLSILPSLLSEVTQVHGQPILGATVPSLFTGAAFSHFGVRIEDGDLCGVNLHHGGAPKVWNIMPPKEAKKLGEILDTECILPLRYKAYFLTTEFLAKNGIQFSVLNQRSGEIVLLYSRAYHQGYNAGWDVTEAVNFGFDDWIDFATTSNRCNCKPSPDVQIPLAWLIARHQPERFDRWLEGTYLVNSEWIPEAPVLANAPTNLEIELARNLTAHNELVSLKKVPVESHMALPVQIPSSQTASESQLREETNGKPKKRYTRHQREQSNDAAKDLTQKSLFKGMNATLLAQALRSTDQRKRCSQILAATWTAPAGDETTLRARIKEPPSKVTKVERQNIMGACAELQRLSPTSGELTERLLSTIILDFIQNQRKKMKTTNTN